MTPSVRKRASGKKLDSDAKIVSLDTVAKASPRQSSSVPQCGIPAACFSNISLEGKWAPVNRLILWHFSHEIRSAEIS